LSAFSAYIAPTSSPGKTTGSGFSAAFLLPAGIFALSFIRRCVIVVNPSGLPKEVAMALTRSLRNAVLALSLLLALALAGAFDAARAQALSDADRNAIHGVIQSQLNAFRRDDSGTAFGFAAPAIQSMYGSPEMFLEAVRRAYRPVYRPRQVEFRDLKTIDGAIVQQVYVVGPDNEPKLALYIMERQPDGTWRISGCVLLDFEGQSV
jgi:hypothetical protein